MIIYTISISSMTDSFITYARNLKEVSKMLISTTVPGIAMAVAQKEVPNDIKVPFYFPKEIDMMQQPSIN